MMGFRMLASVGGRGVGLLCLAAVVMIWVASSELIQFIFDEIKFEHPLFLTFYSTSLFSVYLLGFVVCPSWRKEGGQFTAVPQDLEATHGLLDSTGSVVKQTIEMSEQELEYVESKGLSASRKSPKEVLKLAAYFVPFWLAANWTFNLSLCLKCGSGTSVASNTIVSSTSSLFTLILSVLCLGEGASLIKLVCVLVSCLGVAMVALYDGDDTDEPATMHGDLIALVSACLFGGYSVLLKYLIPNEDSVNMPMFFGFLGVLNALICVPLLVIFNAAGWEKLEQVPWTVMGFLTLNGLIGTVLSDLLWAKAVVLTSPLIVNLGMSTTIPLSFLADSINPMSKNPPLDWHYVLGAVMVFLSFVGVTMASQAIETQRGAEQVGGQGNELVIDDLEGEMSSSRAAGVRQAGMEDLQDDDDLEDLES